MKNYLLTSLSIAIFILSFAGCDSQPIATIAVESTEISTPTATIKPTATFLPTFTLAPFSYSATLFPTQTLTPLTKDIFDNFQGLSGNCRGAGGLTPIRKLAYEYYPIEINANVSISFDKDGYFSGDSIELLASLYENYDHSKPINGIVVKVFVEEPALKRYSFYLYDDGTHKDEKAEDGIYANIFHDTLKVGIYKFYFKFSRLNKTTGEKIVEECYLAKTVNPKTSSAPLSTSGEESNSCREIKPSNPIIVRPEGVGGNDIDFGVDRTSPFNLGWMAFYPKAVSLGDRILTLWQTSFDGQYPKPNVYMRILDDNLLPVGEVKLLFERNVINHMTLINKEDNAVFAYCGRYKVGSTYEDRATSAFIDSNGNIHSEQARSPSNRVCGTAPLAVWTGSRLLFYSWSSSYSDTDLILDVADANGNSVSWRTVDGIGFPALGHGQVLMASPNDWSSPLTIHRFDLEGNDLVNTAILDALTYEVDEKVVVGNFRSAYAVPTADGWMVVASLYSPGIYVARLSPNGTLISEPTILEKNLYFPNGIDDVFAYKGGIVIFGYTSVNRFSGYDVILFISGDGKNTAQWLPAEDDLPMYGSFFEHQGRLFMIYTSEPTGAPPTNQVLIRELKCAK